MAYVAASTLRVSRQMQQEGCCYSLLCIRYYCVQARNLSPRMRIHAYLMPMTLVSDRVSGRETGIIGHHGSGHLALGKHAV